MAASQWLAIDPDATEKQRVPDQPDGLLIEFGYWPPQIETKLRARLKDVTFFKQAPAEESRSTSDLEAQYALDDELLREAIRWSVRSWEGEPAPILEDGEIAGRKFKRLSEKSIDLLHRNRILPAVAIAAALFNITGADAKK